MRDLMGLGALDLAQAIARRDLSPVDLMRATLARIDAVNGDVNAIVSLRDRETLMGEARLAEAMAPEGWLHGIPVAIKDLVGVKGLRSTWGSPILAGNVPVEDDAIVRRMRAAGAIIIGKTNVPQFGLGSHSTNPVFGPTRNPMDLSKTAGGSSGGAAAALATGMLAIADGSDMMGSLRNPAAWCDVWGMRPTVGLVTGDVRDAVLLHRLSTLGPMARDLADLSAFLGTLSGGAFDASADASTKPRIGWLGDWGGAYPMEAGILGSAEAAVARMPDLGWTVEAVAPPVPADLLWQSWTDLRSFAVAMDLAIHYRDEDTRARLNPQAQWEVARGLAMTGDRVEAAAALRRDWLAALDQLFAQYDAVVLPSTQVWPFPVDWDWPREIAGQGLDTYHRWMEVVVPASLAGLPVVNLPAGIAGNGLSHGLQLIGPAGSDARLLTLAAAWEEMMGPRPIHRQDALRM
ncbi:Amidase [Roseibacterium elongatum DSM 19469]|uniref:Amidase n=1 Tax=Roseicyclus elongatus DSM 19469 TaxID=1294273 RepID=W8SQY1_9RHOB|nr:amidase [Roseibacterium elongatum]AHM04910.1 Amidase [Roseibacterium elongatum DSM 19469]